MKRIFLVMAAIAISIGMVVLVSHRTPSVATAAVPPAAVTPAPAMEAAAAPPSSGNLGPAAAYVEGQSYRRVRQPTPIDNPRQVKVEEFFWYGCPHCFHMESLLKDWLPSLPADARFVRVPDNLGLPVGLIHQRAFYAARDLGIEDRIHLPLMTGLIVQHLSLVTPQAIASFVATQTQVTSTAFNSQYQSFVVAGETDKASELALQYGITSVPSIVVGGKYLVDSDLPGLSGGNDDESARFQHMLEIARYLIDQTRAEQAPAQQ